MRGFTLSELLIAITLLGVLAIFTIPKVINTASESGWNADAKQTIMLIHSAYSDYKMENQPDANFDFGDITSYIKYVKIDTVTQIDADQGQLPGNACGSGGWECLRLHSGALLKYHPFQTFNNTSSTNALYVYFDPDGKVTDGTANGPGHSVIFVLYTDGKLLTGGESLPGSANNWGGIGGSDPPWFDWNG